MRICSPIRGLFVTGRIRILTGLVIGLFLAFLISNLTAFVQLHFNGTRQIVQLGYSIDLASDDSNNNTMETSIELHPSPEKKDIPVTEQAIVVMKPEKEVRVLCWILTQSNNYNSRAIPVNNTWARHCTKYIFFASFGHYSFDIPIMYLKVPEGRQHLTKKSVLAFRYIYRHFLNQFDWFLKADDDTFVIVKNLQYFLQDKDPNEPIFFGQRFKRLFGLLRAQTSYVSGGAGYVLSREALRRFGEKGEDTRFCSQDGIIEDYDMSRCLKNLGVVLGESSDSLGRNRFNCFAPEHHLMGPMPQWYKDIEGNGAKVGKQALNEYVITFHYVKGYAMYVLDFLIYTLKVHNRNQTSIQ